MSKRFSMVNGMATKANKPFTAGSISFIKRNANRLSLRSIAAILHRTTNAVRSVARRNGVSFR